VVGRPINRALVFVHEPCQPEHRALAAATTADLTVLEHDAQVMTNTQLSAQLSGQSPQVRAEVIRINTDARHRALPVALIVPVLAGLLGLGASFRMVRLPDPDSSGADEGTLLADDG
jgi:hypothetical protein